MSDLIVVDNFCGRCGVALLAADNFCRNCGHPTIARGSAPAQMSLSVIGRELAVVPPGRLPAVPPRGQSLVAGVLENRLYVMAILLCAGPIGLPALWFSHRFSRRFKFITTTGYVLFTLILPLVIAWYVFEVALRPIADALS